MKQYRPIFAIGYGDGIGVCKKISDLPTDGGSVFFCIVMPPVPIVGLFLGIDNEPAAVGKTIGVVGRDPEVKGYRPLVGMRGYALALIVVTIDPHVGEMMISENPWETLI